MRRTVSIFVAVAVAVALTHTPASSHAVVVDGKWGVGFEETLTGIPDPADDDTLGIQIPAVGLAVHRFAGNWDFEAIFGARAQFTLTAPVRWATFLSLGGHYFAFRAPRANLSVGVRAIAGVHQPIDFGSQKAGDLQWGMSFEVPLRAMFFLSEHFAISGAVGIVAAIETKNGNPLTGGKDAVKINLFKGGFSGGLGFTFLFR